MTEEQAKWRSIAVTGVRTDGTDRFRADREKDLWRRQKYYRQARAEGSQPAGTSMEQIEHAMRTSDDLGRAFDAAHLGRTYHPEIDRELKPMVTSPYTGAPMNGAEG